MDVSHLMALDKAAEWLRWVEAGGYKYWRMPSDREDDVDAEFSGYLFITSASSGNIFFMHRKFCEMVTHACDKAVMDASVTDALQFEENWMVTPTGFMWLETPFQFGLSRKVTGRSLGINAVGWVRHHEHYEIEGYSEMSEGCIPWGGFSVRQGDTIANFMDRLLPKDAEGEDFEDWCSTVRWIYAALHTMAERMTIVVNQDANRATKRRLERENSPVPPLVRIVTLRRLEQDRLRAQTSGTPMEHDYCWDVRGHWRLQPYPTTGERKWIYIDAFVKGDLTKPFKPPVIKLFKAKR
jgi:hypothetical protein